MNDSSVRGRKLESAFLVVLLALAAGFYFWTATSAGSPLTSGLAPDDLYNRLADGFLAGRTSFLEEPPPELAALANPYDPAANAPYAKYHDVTYYRGRYYLYFGPTPVLVLLAPWKLITGTSLPHNLAVVVFAWGSALLGVVLVRQLRDRFFPQLPGWMFAGAALAVVFGNLLPVLLRRPLHYELAIASAGFFGLLALIGLLRTEGDRRPLLWLAGSGLALGLAVGARPNYAFAAMAVMGFLGWMWWRALPETGLSDRIRRWLRPGLAIGLPFAVLMFALMAYNFARFGSVAEFGTSYMLAGSNQQGVSQFSLRYVPINLYYHLLAPGHLGAYFPFVLVTGFPPFTPATGYAGQENMYGVLVTLPVLWALFPLWRALKSGAPARPWLTWARGAGVLVIGNLALLLMLMGGANRYQLDYVPGLTVLAVLGCWQLDATLAGWRRGLLRGAWLLGLAVTVGFNLLVSLQHNELLKYHNPATYAKLARAANGLAEPLTGAGRRSGPLRIELTLPRERTGKLEPLVVTGWSFRADFIYIFYTDDRHIQIGFEHTSYGGPMSPPIRVDYDLPHVLEVEMGSLYPPAEHPYFDGRDAEETTRLKRTLRVVLDGRPVHEGLYDFYDASPGDVSVGRNHVSEAFGRKFTGVVRSVTRPAEMK